MHKRLTWPIYSLALLAVVVCITPTRTQAQVVGIPPVNGATAFAIAEADSFPYTGADAVIVRRTTFEPHDVILVRGGKGSTRLLAEAVGFLGGLRAIQGDSPTTNGIYRVVTKGKPHRWERHSHNWMSTLASERPRPISGLGEKRHIVLFLKNQHKTSK
jgi:hypothetical protein